MPVDIEKSFGDVVVAMEKLTDAFQLRVVELQKLGRDESDIKSLKQGAMAMQDSSGIYLAWARHFMSKLGEIEGFEENEEAEITEK